jgi:hypothetical protein
MSDSKPQTDAEFSAMQTLYAALEPLDDDARSRVVNYIVARLEISSLVALKLPNGNSPPSTSEDEVNIAEEEKGARKYSSLAELFDAAQPKSNADKALIAGYWLQVCQSAETFDAQSANKELKHLGEGLANITNAMESLKIQKPALALQLKKSGKSQQARKVYKITVAGIKAVENMTNT